MYKDYETPRFWISYGDGLKKYIDKRINDKMFAEDVLHDVYIKIYAHCKRYDFCCNKAGVKNLRSWVFQVCHNTLVDHYKTRSKYFYLMDFREEINIEVHLLKLDEPVSAESILNSLPKKYREALIYEFYFSLKQAEIAERMGLSLSATKSRILRGKQMLVERYQGFSKSI